MIFGDFIWLTNKLIDLRFINIELSYRSYLKTIMLWGVVLRNPKHSIKNINPENQARFLHFLSQTPGSSSNFSSGTNFTSFPTRWWAVWCDPSSSLRYTHEQFVKDYEENYTLVILPFCPSLKSLQTTMLTIIYSM